MGSAADLHALRGNAYALRHEPIRFLEESFRIDHHAVAEYAGLARVNDSRRQQVKHKIDRRLNGVAALWPP